MIQAEDIMLGQLAIARGWITLIQLMSSVEKAGATGRELSDILITDGYLTNANVAELKARLSEDEEAVSQELVHGQTIVIEQLNQSVGLSETYDEAPPGFSFDVDLSAKGRERYSKIRDLGRGGMGEVIEAKDSVMMRQVAMKQLLDSTRDDKNRHRLLLEAQVTGLLEHPNIVPVYDLLEDAAGNPYYTMRVVQEKSLAQILFDVESGDVDVPLTQLVSILRQVSLAIQFAHDKGVVHRDLKPENILIGKYGEVYVIDWGIAKILNAEIGLETTDRSSGSLVGTPQYMAPEQARGDSDSVDARSDVYALGAILYEILTLQPMFRADHILGLLFMVVHDDPVAPSEKTDRNVPAVLEEICLKAVEKHPRDRFQTSQGLADELELFLDGVKEAERQRELAAAALNQAMQVQAVFHEVRDQHRELLGRIQELRTSGQKDELWTTEQTAEDLSVEIERRFTDSVRHYSQALVHEPKLSEAREAISGLYWERFRDAEIAGDRALAAYFEGLVRQYNDGRYDRLLEGGGHLSFHQTILDSASLTLYRYHTVKRRLVEWEVAEVTSPEMDISHGSYVVQMKSDIYADMAIPFLLDRGERLTVEIPTLLKERLPEGVLVVPAGRFVSKPPSVNDGIPELEVIPTFGIQKTPVTVGAYLEFINDLSASGRDDEALEHLPRWDNKNYLEKGADGRYAIPDADPDGDPWQEGWPIAIVNFHDAMAYAKWLSKKTGFRFRLPTILEWQKAARGTDGRIYPWGNAFDPSFCHMRDSRPGRSVPTQVGSYPADLSPYGAIDMCGNVAEWTSSPEGDGAYYLGGASHNSFAEMCKLDFTMSSPPKFKFGHYGIRLAVDFDF